MASLAERKKQMRDLGLRVTAPRLAVLQVLAEAERPLSHSEVVQRLGDDAVWDRVTVYRNLIALVGVYLVRVASHAGGVCRYELARGGTERAHPHFLRDDCGIVSCLPETAVITPEIVTPEKTHWVRSLRAAEVQFVGRCPSCAQG